jgi:serine/threonine-protein kinase
MAGNTPNSIREWPGAGEPTAPYWTGNDQFPEPPRQLRVALVPGAGPQPVGEIQRLLRKRLRVIVCIVSAFYAVQLVRCVCIHFQWLTGPPTTWFALGFYGLILATVGGLAGVLWSGRPLSLRSLRAVELITFLQITAFAAWITQDELRSEWVRRYSTADDLGPLLVTRAHALNWFVLIVLYGTLIPNTWRRCAAVAGVMALTPLAVAAAVGLSDDVLRRHLLVGYLTDLAVWVTTAVAIAVYGSHRIEVLRREAAEAGKLGQYLLKRRLGAGGMGEVYLSEHLLLRRPCALKLIRPERAGDPKHLARFEREVRATAALTHPNTVQIFDYGHTEDGTFYYVMEYLPGLTLDQLVQEHGPLPPARAVYVLRQLCGALGEAHARGLVHRDVKPGNVMLCERGGAHDVAKLLDFGLVIPPAQDLDEKLTQEGVVPGTPAYLSPEQAGGSEDLDARSDIYGVGALAYFLLTGRPPFAGRSAMQMLAAHLYEKPQPLTDHRPDVPVDLEAVVLRCLAKDREARFPDAESLDVALAECSTVGGWTEREAAQWWRACPGRGECPGAAVGQRAGRTKRCT